MKKILLALSLLLTSCDVRSSEQKVQDKIRDKVTEEFTLDYDDDVLGIKYLCCSKDAKWFKEHSKYAYVEIIYIVDVYGVENKATYLAAMEDEYSSVEVWNYDTQSK